MVPENHRLEQLKKMEYIGRPRRAERASPPRHHTPMVLERTNPATC